MGGGQQARQRKGNQRNQPQRKGNQRGANQRSQAAKAVASARGVNAARTKTIAAIVVIVVFAAAIIGYVLYSNNQKQSQADGIIKTSTVNSNYPVSMNNGVVSAGKPAAKIKLDFYEDFICPSCGQFNEFFASDVETQLEKGAIQVNYHMLPFLDSHSSPAGYSGRAAAASLAVAADAPTKYPSFAHSLFADQAQEGSAGYSNDQLISLGQRLGVGGAFAEDVRSGKYMDTVQKVYAAAQGPVTKANNGSFATPTVLHNGVSQVWGTNGPDNQAVKTHWLDDLISKG